VKIYLVKIEHKMTENICWPWQSNWWSLLFMKQNTCVYIDTSFKCIYIILYNKKSNLF